MMAISTLVLGAWILPLASFILVLLIRSRLEKAIASLSTVLLFLAFCFSMSTLFMAWDSPDITMSWTWFSINNMKTVLQWKIDNLSVLMLTVVNFISLLVHIYSTAYMKGDSGIKRYFATLGFFTFSMLGIVLSDNILMTFFFWELVGFSSYLLIGHWREKPEAGAAATKAFLINRVGDVGFLIGIGLLWAYVGSLNYSDLLIISKFDNPALSTCIGLLIFCGVVGKSAQFPLSTWLPDAMEGPTPVSALIHAATMVAAGVYLLARLYFLFTPSALLVVLIIGSITALWGAMGALKAIDIKKILAYSTVSQLGFMILGMGSGSFTGSIMHLFTHAFFKACLFLGAGAIIHYLHKVQHQTQAHFDVQDIRNMGGLRKHLPKTFIGFLLAASALSGLPLFSGFISKDAILTQLYTNAQNDHPLSWLFLIVAFITSFMTVYYSFRMVYFVFFGESRTAGKVDQVKEKHLSLSLIIPILLLASLSFWIVIAWNPFSFSGWLYDGLNGTTHHQTVISVISFLWIALALLFSYFHLRYKTAELTPAILPDMDRFYDWFIVSPVRQLSTLTLLLDKRWIDRGIHFTAYTHVMIAHLAALCDRYIVDSIVNRAASLAKSIGNISRSLANGKIQSYLLWATASLLIFILWILLS